MRQRVQLGFSLLALLAAGITLSVVWLPLLASSEADYDESGQSAAPLSPQQIRKLVDRAIENQQRNDGLLDQYARTEHQFIRGGGKDPDKDTVRRLIPVGEGLLHVELQHNGKVTDAPYREQQWRSVMEALAASAQGEEIREAGLYDGARHRHERSEMVAAIGKAFVFRWAGRGLINGRSVVKLTFEPDPAYRSSARFAPVYAHSKGIAWVDESSQQLIKAEAELTDDVSWAAGFIAKLYRGGRFVYEQQEVGPDLWMPTYYAYDFDGRKFFFTLSAHERVEFRDYLRIGPPKEALIVLRHENPNIFANKN